MTRRVRPAAAGGTAAILGGGTKAGVPLPGSAQSQGQNNPRQMQNQVRAFPMGAPSALLGVGIASLIRLHHPGMHGTAD